MSEHRDLRLIPDWPRIRQLVALHLGKSEDEIQAMKKVKIRLIGRIDYGRRGSSREQEPIVAAKLTLGGGVIEWAGCSEGPNQRFWRGVLRARSAGN